METPPVARGKISVSTMPEPLDHANRIWNSHTLIPPLGYKIAGVAGSCAEWVDGFSLIIQH
jgi:hypothetical protein